MYGEDCPTYKYILRSCRFQCGTLNKFQIRYNFNKHHFLHSYIDEALYNHNYIPLWNLVGNMLIDVIELMHQLVNNWLYLQSKFTVWWIAIYNNKSTLKPKFSCHRKQFYLLFHVIISQYRDQLFFNLWIWHYDMWDRKIVSTVKGHKLQTRIIGLTLNFACNKYTQETSLANILLQL